MTWVVDTIDYGGEQFVALWVPPNWARPVEISYDFTALIDRAITGFGYRQATALYPSLRMRYSATVLTDGDGQLLRNALAAVGRRRVVVPLWVDLEEQPPLHDTGLWLRADGEALTLHSSDPGGMRAPALIGRLEESADISAITDSLADIRIGIREEGSIKQAVVVGPWPPSTQWGDWEPNWAMELTQGYGTFLEYDKLDDANAQEVVQGDAAGRWNQGAKFSCGRSDLGALLGFWAGRWGSVRAFAAPAWYSPGNSTASAPTDFGGGEYGLCRFADEALTVRFAAPDMAEVSVRLEQTFASDAEAPFTAWLYECWSDYAPTERSRFTSAGTPIYAEGAWWQPRSIRHDTLRQSLKPQNERLKIETVHAGDAVLGLLRRGESEAGVYVSVWEYVQGGACTQVFLGRARKASLQGTMLRFEVAAFAGLLSRKLPKCMLTRTCNHAVFDPGCGLERAAFVCEGEFVFQNAGGALVLSVSQLAAALPSVQQHAVDPGETAAAEGTHWLNTTTGRMWLRASAEWREVDWWAGGWVEVGDGLQMQVRTITRGYWQAGASTMVLYLARGVDTAAVDAGDVVRFWPGCDGTLTTCTRRYANDGAFLGFPFAPAHIEQKPAGGTPTGK